MHEVMVPVPVRPPSAMTAHEVDQVAAAGELADAERQARREALLHRLELARSRRRRRVVRTA